MTSVKAIPDGYHTVTPYLLVDRVADFIQFLERAFGAKETQRSAMPDGTVMHAAVQIGDSMVMMGQASGSWKAMTAMLYLYVLDVDRVYERALEAGAKTVREPRDEFYGDRAGGVEDPWGHQWWIATHKEDVHPEELQRRFAAARAQQAS
jgi:uncharacterized glyoxalase superfamily protein PhnB